MTMLRRATDYLLILLIFLLPIQTQLRIEEETLQGADWDFGRISLYAIDILALAVIAASAATQPMRRRRTSQAGFILLGIFCVSLLLSVVLNHEAPQSWYLALRFLVGFGVAWSIANSRLPAWTLSTSFIASMGLNALFAVWQSYAQQVPHITLLSMAPHFPHIGGTSIVGSTIGRYLRAYGTLPHPNILGGFLGIALLLAIVFALRLRFSHVQKPARRVVIRSLFIGVIGLLFMALLLSFSRSAWVGLACGVGLLSITSCIMPKKRMRTWALLAIVFAVVGIVVAGSLFPLFRERVVAQDPHEKTSIADRQEITNDALAILKENWWKGVGLTRFGTYVVDNIDPDRSIWHLHPVHNVVLLLASEASVFPALLFLILFVKLCLDAFKKTREAIDESSHFPLAAGALALLAFLGVVAMFDNYFVALAPGLYLLFFVFGLCFRFLYDSSDHPRSEGEDGA